jgi:hypothetical protein
MLYILFTTDVKFEFRYKGNEIGLDTRFTIILGYWVFGEIEHRMIRVIKIELQKLFNC